MKEAFSRFAAYVQQKMATVAAACSACGILLLVTFKLISPSIPIPGPDFRGTNLPIAIQYLLLALEAVVAVLTLAIAVFTAGFLLFCFVWTLTGAGILPARVKETWQKIETDDFFAENTPSWYDPKSGDKATTARDVRAPDQEAESQPAIRDQLCFKNGNRENFYRPLDESRDGFRMRLMKPDVEGSSGVRMSFTMSQHTLSSQESKYVALSYCNGNEPPTETIVVDGFEIEIRRTLFRALAKIRQLQDYQNDSLWIDAIYIDQGNKFECDAQVARMRHIYRRAKVVVAWVDKAFDLSSERSGYGTFTSESDPNHPDGIAGIPKSVLVNQYWHRLWIVQEYSINPQLLILTSEGPLEEQTLNLFLTGRESANHTSEYTQVRLIAGIRNKVKEGVEPTLLDLLMRTKASQSQRRHDRIFSILSIAFDRSKFGEDLQDNLTSVVKYEEQEHHLSRLMTRHFLEKNPDMPVDLILLGGLHFGDVLQSWCPDFFRFDSMPPDTRLFDYVCDKIEPRNETWSLMGSSIKRPLFKAASGSGSQLEFIGDGKDMLLQTVAYHVGTIHTLGWIASDGKISSFPRKGPQELFPATCEDAVQVLWRLLLALSMRDSQMEQLADKASSSEDSMFSGSYKARTAAYKYFTLLVFGGILDTKDEGFPEPWWAQWLCRNRQMIFGQATLQDHARQMEKNLKRLGFWKWAGSIKTSLHAGVLNSELRDWKRMHAPLKTIAEEHMRLMPIAIDEKPALGLAHAAARSGDVVFLIPACSVPVILRKAPGDRYYTIVGDAIIPGFMSGERWAKGEASIVKMK